MLAMRPAHPPIDVPPLPVDDMGTDLGVQAAHQTMIMSAPSCPRPGCPPAAGWADWAVHCPTTDGRSPCSWRVCRTCQTVIDLRRPGCSIIVTPPEPRR